MLKKLSVIDWILIFCCSHLIISFMLMGYVLATAILLAMAVGVYWMATADKYL